MNAETMEFISTLAPLIFYGIVAIVAIALAIYKIVVKIKKGEDVSMDVDTLTEMVSSVLTKKFTKYTKSKGVTVDEKLAADVLTSSTKAILNSSSQLDKEETNK